jgi:hypothetical protein
MFFQVNMLESLDVEDALQSFQEENRASGSRSTAGFK